MVAAAHATHMQIRFVHLKGSLGESLDAGLHTLQQGLSDMGQGLSNKVYHLSDRVAALEGAMQQRVAELEEGVAHSVAALEAGVQHGVAALSDELLQLREGLAHLPGSIQASSQQLAAALRAHVQEQLASEVQWPTPRWPLYVYFFGAMICLLTSTVCHTLGCCAQHISTVIWCVWEWMGRPAFWGRLHACRHCRRRCCSNSGCCPEAVHAGSALDLLPAAPLATPRSHFPNTGALTTRASLC